jgi:hypothetical protein
MNSKRILEDYDKTHLITISFDPAYDTPAVLRRYGLAYLDGDARGFSHWDFASTTREDLERIAHSFGLQYEGQDNQIVHTMNIVLIAPNGSVAYFWNTNWTWLELINSLRRAAHNVPNLRGQGLTAISALVVTKSPTLNSGSSRRICMASSRQESCQVARPPAMRRS